MFAITGNSHVAMETVSRSSWSVMDIITVETTVMKTTVVGTYKTLYIFSGGKPGNEDNKIPEYNVVILSPQSQVMT